MSKDTTVTFRVSEDELATIRTNARASRQTVSDYIRDAIKSGIRPVAEVNRTWSFVPMSPDTWVNSYPQQSYTFTPSAGVTFQLFN